MRKIVGSGTQESATDGSRWFDLESLASVAVSSEDVGYPVEGALLSSTVRGWRAAFSGAQVIRLSFDKPLHIRRILVEVHEPEAERAQELTISRTTEGGAVLEVMRQRWNFSPDGSTHELEDYRVELPGTVAITFTILPDLQGRGVLASLTRLRLG